MQINGGKHLHWKRYSVGPLREHLCQSRCLLWNCKFTAASCRDICSVLSTNQSLRKLQLEGNELGDEGVKLLCEGLKHPKCGLKTIG
uniref:Uncharacterized protein n=1 Tax=Salvator merianae TaxID=96440 RepID=A0A8D0C4A9_SALMN